MEVVVAVRKHRLGMILGFPETGKSIFEKRYGSTKSVVACYNNAGQPGGAGPVIVTARLNVAASGSVSSVTVLGALGSGAVGSCISSKLKTAKFPPFQNGPQTVPMTFRVK